MFGRYQNRKACLLENDSIYVLPYWCHCFMRYATRHTAQVDCQDLNLQTGFIGLHNTTMAC